MNGEKMLTSLSEGQDKLSEAVKEISIKLGKLEASVNGIKEDIKDVVFEDTCEARMDSLYVSISAIQETIKNTRKDIQVLMGKIEEVIKCYITKDDLVKFLIVVSGVFTIVNIIISIVIKH